MRSRRSNGLLITVTLRDQVLGQYAFDTDLVKIGRHRACDIVIDNPAISRVHAEIACDDDVVSVRDAGSSNGIQLNGVTVREGELNDGDVVTIGKFTIHVAMPAQRDETTHSSLTFTDPTLRVRPDAEGRKT